MLTLLAIIAFLFMIASIIALCVSVDCDVRYGWGVSIGISAFVFVGIGTALICGGTILATSKKIDSKIEMYTEENSKIEIVITDTVEKYLEHEYNIFDSLQGEDISTLLVMYPEINSNELVKNNIEIFVENNNKIKQLKNKKINLATWKFLLYFGN